MIVRVVENKKKEEIVRGKGVLFGPIFAGFNRACNWPTSN